jgi:hypothetical protein
MDQATLEKTIELQMVDPNSCDTITKSIQTVEGSLREEFYLKETGSPTPTLEVYGNIPCVLLRPQTSGKGPALLTVFEEGTRRMENTPWVRALVASGISTLGIDFSPADPPGVVVAKLIRGISYLVLRRDVVDEHRICIAGSGTFGLWAFSAAALDTRVVGAMAFGIPTEVSLGGGPVVKTSQLIELLLPRRVAILDTQEAEELRAGLGSSGKTDAVDAIKVENESEPETVKTVMKWLIEPRDKK